MTISPMWIGQTLAPWTVTLVDTNNQPVNLAGATLSLLITNTVNGGSVAGAGSWEILNAPAGQAEYTWSAADTQTAGQYTLQVIATFSGGVQKWQPVAWQLKTPGQL